MWSQSFSTLGQFGLPHNMAALRELDFVAQGNRASASENKVKAASPFITNSTSHAVTLLVHSTVCKPVTSPPRFKGRRMRFYILMEDVGKGYVGWEINF